MGKIYLVGVGSDDPELITLRGLKAIKEAGVILYGQLVNREILNYASPSARFFYCGKDPHRHSLPQEKANKMMVALAEKGHIVARLKDDGPFVFGRGGEEAERLACHNIHFEAIPRITSGITAPAYAEIPVTHRDYSSSVAFVTTVNKPGMDKGKYQQHLASGPETLCIYMGVRRFSKICELLIQYGRSSKTPVALVHTRTSKQQMTVTETLDTIQERAHYVQNPAMIVVGEVVEVREKINWFVEQATVQDETLTEVSSTQRIHLKKQ